ncbi:MAG: general secretion pathway protein GspL [Betaproteobacteria bacterium]|nr:general secretion pathway protein GspL [Betaproteobacteria bacterium]
MGALIVLLPPVAASAAVDYDFAVCSAAPAVVRHGRAQLSALPAVAGQHETVVVVPAQQLSWHRVTLPRGTPRQGPRLRQVLEGLIEEQLLDDPADLHLALVPGADLGIVDTDWVCVCERAWLASHLQALEAAGRPAQRIVAEAAPSASPQLSIDGEEDRPRALYSDAAGLIACPLAAAAWPPLPEDLVITTAPATAARAELLGRRVQLQGSAQRWMAAWRADVDLAQQEFATSGGRRAWQRLGARWQSLWRAPQWRPLRWGVALLVLVHLVGLNAWAQRERSTLAAKQDAARRVLLDTFPKIAVVIDAPLQMERELALLRQATGAASARDLEPLLGALARALPAGRTATSIDYGDSGLRLGGLQLNAAEMTALTQSLAASGVSAHAEGDLLVLRAQDRR